jgi:hypothetical protein
MLKLFPTVHSLRYVSISVLKVKLQAHLAEMLLDKTRNQNGLQEMIMETASTSETSVNFYQTTWSNNPEDSHL